MILLNAVAVSRRRVYTPVHTPCCPHLPIQTPIHNPIHTPTVDTPCPGAHWDIRTALWTNKYLWKHYLPATSFVGGKGSLWSQLTWCHTNNLGSISFWVTQSMCSNWPYTPNWPTHRIGSYSQITWIQTGYHTANARPLGLHSKWLVCIMI